MTRLQEDLLHRAFSAACLAYNLVLDANIAGWTERDDAIAAAGESLYEGTKLLKALVLPETK